MISFLSEKFTPASLPKVCVPRRALLSEFYAAEKDSFLYITAPAGSGKTVSALLWLLDSRRKPVWIGLDEYDNMLSGFYKLVSAGLCSTQPNNKNMRDVLTDQTFSASPVEHTISLISEMRPDSAKRALILDDMHLVTNREILKSLPFVIKRLPRSFVTIILSRAELPESFGNLIKDKRDIITSAQLNFSANEIKEYFNRLGLSLTEDETSVAHIATGGWAIGVNAIAQSGDFNMEQGSRVFARYFEERIWKAWDEGLRDFCLKTSIVDKFTPELAGKLSGRGDAGELIKTLSQSNSFISRLNDDTYRYHHLLVEFLRSRAGNDAAETAALNKIAAEYYAENNDNSMALRFWLNSGDYKGASKYLLLFMFDNHHGNIAEYVDFLRMYFIRDFPDKAFEDFPALHVCCAWYYYMTGQYKEYEKHADAGYKHIVRISLYDPKFVEFAILMYSVDHRSEIINKINQFGVFAKLIKSFSKDGIIRYIASCTHNLPYAHRSSFDYSDILSTPKNVDMLQKSVFMTLLGNQVESVIALGLSGVYYERNDLKAAYSEISLLNASLTEQTSIELRVSAKFLYHSIILKMGRKPEADAALEQLTEFVKNSAPFFLANLEAYKVKLRLIDCDIAAARLWLDNYYIIDAKSIELFMLFQHFTTARAHIVLGNAADARRYLKMLSLFGQNLNRVCDYCEALVLLAALEWAENNKKEAEAVLEEALIKLQRYGYTRLVIDEGISIFPVLKRIAEKTGKPNYDGSLRREFISGIVLETYRFSKHHKGITADFSNSQKTVKLSNQQAMILTQLSRGYSNAMIAAETGLKISTIKTHTAIAYQKLGVNSAIDAVSKAMELGLIASNRGS